MFLTDLTDLRRLERVRQEFVANLVHELKTPITSLRLTAESLLGEPPAKDRTRFADRLIREADLMSRIIDNLRQLAELESGVPTLEPTAFDLVELIEELRPRAGAAHPLHLDAPESVDVTTDRAKLAQAIGNLLDNAAKFSPPGSAIDIRVKALDGTRVLAETEFPWSFGETHQLSLTVEGDRLTAGIDGKPVLEVRDAERPLTGGGVALILEEGRVAVGPVKVSPAGASGAI